MPKQQKDKPPPELENETPFQKFERLARRIVSVPKAKIEERKAEKN